MKKGCFHKFTLFPAAAALTVLLTMVLLPADACAQEKKDPCLAPFINTINPNAAAPGEEVRIRGRRFATEKGEVTFTPDIKAEIVEWKNSRIWVIVPQSAVTGPVTVTVHCGEVSNKKDFTVKK
jgi:hypothetical protein